MTKFSQIYDFPPPYQKTLARYGLGFIEWSDMVIAQRGRCFICQEKKKLCIDHFHVKRWKYLPPDKRKKYVRGLLCFQCNYKILPKGVTIQKLRNAAKYLRNFENKMRKNPA